MKIVKDIVLNSHVFKAMIQQNGECIGDIVGVAAIGAIIMGVIQKPYVICISLILLRYDKGDSKNVL